MNKETYYRVLVVEDHPIVSEGIKTIVSQLEAAECIAPGTMNKLIETLENESFNLYIIDLGLRESNGFHIIEQLNRQHPSGKILVYTMHIEPWIVAKLSTLNIQGAVAKNSHLEELQMAVKAIRNGGTYFSREFADLPSYKKSHPTEKVIASELAEREKEVLTYLSQGMSTSDIAQKMFLSTNTVHTYRKRLMNKMNAKNVAELIYKTKDLF